MEFRHWIRYFTAPASREVLSSFAVACECYRGVWSEDEGEPLLSRIRFVKAMSRLGYPLRQLQSGELAFNGLVVAPMLLYKPCVHDDGCSSDDGDSQASVEAASHWEAEAVADD